MFGPYRDAGGQNGVATGLLAENLLGAFVCRKPVGIIEGSGENRVNFWSPQLRFRRSRHGTFVALPRTDHGRCVVG